MSTASSLAAPESELEHGDAQDTLFFERRQVDRWPVQGIATAFCVSGDDFGRMHELRMLDCSYHGMGAISDRPMVPGMIITIGFQAPGHSARRGVVLRCTPCGSGYRVAIQFELRMAA